MIRSLCWFEWIDAKRKSWPRDVIMVPGPRSAANVFSRVEFNQKNLPHSPISVPPSYMTESR